MIRPCFFTDEVAVDFEESVRLGTAAGARGLEIRGRLFGQSIENISDDDMERIQDVAARYGAEVAVLASPFGKCSHEKPEEIARHHRIFARMVELAQQCSRHPKSGDFGYASGPPQQCSRSRQTSGPPLIRGFAFWNPRKSDRERPDIAAYRDVIVPFLEPAVRLAEEAGVTLCLETEGATMGGTCAETRQIIDALGNSPALQLAWDVNNAWHCGEEPLPDGYAQVRGRVRHVHVKPNAAGNIDSVAGSATGYREVFQALLADGYDGWASIEHWGRPEGMLSGIRQLVTLLEGVQ